MSIIQHDPLSIPAPRADDGHAIGHPSWCRPADCTITPDVDDELLVVHRHVVLDEPLDATAGARLVVDVVRGDIVCAHGGEVIAQDATAVRVDLPAPHDVGGELTPDQAGRLAVAVAQAVCLAGGAR